MAKRRHAESLRVENSGEWKRSGEEWSLFYLNLNYLFFQQYGILLTIKIYFKFYKP